MSELKWEYKRTVSFSEPITEDEQKYLNELFDCSNKLRSLKDRVGLANYIKILFGYLKL